MATINVAANKKYKTYFESFIKLHKSVVLYNTINKKKGT